jgi:integrase
VLNPRQFLDQYVMPCVRDWQLDPLNVRKAVIAISQIDILADHVIIHQHPGFTRVQLANVRKATEQNSPMARYSAPPLVTRNVAERMRLGLGKPGDDALVFCEDSGAPYAPKYFSVRWRRATASLVDVTFHALRHSHASALIAAGVDVVTVSRRLGHSSPAITLRVYAHLFTKTDTTAAAAIEATLRGGK